jgi:hypothetical protein
LGRWSLVRGCHHPLLQKHARSDDIRTQIWPVCFQEGYLEEALKLCNVLREFDICIPGGSPPAIVGFREHIFSGLGTLGNFAATAELVFGTLVQRTLSRPLWSRYHYGHPDVMDKLVLMAQGGLSKATKGLNLSEDVFAGMDAQLRGHNIVHREYFQVRRGGADSATAGCPAEPPH